jgi:hypothetical protein
VIESKSAPESAPANWFVRRVDARKYPEHAREVERRIVELKARGEWKRAA